MKTIIYCVCIILLTFSGCSCSGGVTDCNPNNCLHLIHQILNKEDNSDLCLTFSKLETCIQSCNLPFVDSNLWLEGFANVRNKMCHDFAPLNKDLKNNCINGRMFEFGSCLIQTWSVEYKERKPDENIVICRKIFDSENCPIKVFSHCLESTAMYIDDLLLAFLSRFKSKYCVGFLSPDIDEIIAVSNDTYARDISELATCYDTNLNQFFSCLTNQRTFNLNENSQLCSTFREILKCVEDVTLNKCGPKALALSGLAGKYLSEVFLKDCYAESSTQQVTVTTVTPVKMFSVSKNIVDSRKMIKMPEKSKMTPTTVIENKIGKNVSVIQEDYSVSDIIIIHYHIDGSSVCGIENWLLFAILLCNFLFLL